VRGADDHAFEQRKATILAILDDDGDVTVEDGGKGVAVRSLEFALDGPRRPLPTLARFRYGEIHRREGDAWILADYRYEYLDVEHGGRVAYHWHDLPGRVGVHHLHCRPPTGRPTMSHFRSYAVDLLEAHDEFIRSYAAGTPIDCSSLRPLRPDD